MDATPKLSLGDRHHAQQLRKRCGYRGCPNTTTDRYCDEHLCLMRRVVDRRRGSTTERGYDSDWERVAEQRRILNCSLCQMCLLEERIIASRLVDHIYPIHIRPDWRLEILNTQVLCRPCHTRKTSTDNQRYGGPSSTPNTTQRANRLAAQQVAMHRGATQFQQTND